MFFNYIVLNAFNTKKLFTYLIFLKAGSDHTWTLLIENNIVDTGGII